jgi:putative transposase
MSCPSGVIDAHYLWREGVVNAVLFRHMEKSFTQIYIHAVYAVKHRYAILDKAWREEVFRYSSTVISSLKCKPIAISGTEDHVHLLIGLNPEVTIPDLMSRVKANSSRLINDKFFPDRRFQWQTGYGAFSCGKSDIPRVAGYIENQEAYHAHHSFRKEYIGLLKEYKIEYDTRYLFEFFDPEPHN